jgi:hypothetical protein
MNPKNKQFLVPTASAPLFDHFVKVFKSENAGCLVGMPSWQVVLSLRFGTGQSGTGGTNQGQTCPKWDNPHANFKFLENVTLAVRNHSISQSRHLMKRPKCQLCSTAASERVNVIFKFFLVLYFVPSLSQGMCLGHGTAGTE